MRLTAPPPKFSLDSVSGWSARAIAAAISGLVVVPCFWTSGIRTGGLSTHAYNAWLAGQIREGHAAGLRIVAVWTNVLADWGLDLLARWAGSAVALQCVTAAAALIFFWGAFFLLNAVSGRRPWTLFPLLGILTYGVVFHFGFLNFYISAGLSLWILGLLWKPSRGRMICAALLAVPAILAHAAPPAWAAAVLAYLYVFRSAPAPVRLLLPAVSIVGLMAAPQIFTGSFGAPWRWSQVGRAAFAVADQVWVYDAKYLLIAGGVLLCMLWLFVRKIERLDFIGDPVLQIWILHLAVFLVSSGSGGFLISDPALTGAGMSLFVAIAFLVMTAGLEQGHGITRLSSVAAIAFFAFLYLDSGALNRTQDEITRLVRAAPEGARVVVSITDQGSRVNGLAHAADWACIGHCFSYGNYVPAADSFRIRSDGQEGGAAAPEMTTVGAIERGEHVVTPAEAPLYAVCACESGPGALCLRRLEAGQRTCASARPVTFRVWEGLP